MILRKPYAFLIKYFQKINIILLAFIVFLFYKTMRFHQFAKNYLSTNVYNSTIDSISNYVNKYVIISFVFVFIISIILTYLLRKKDKPYISYILIIVVNIFAFGLLLYANNFFTYTAFKGFKIVNAKMISDLSLIANILYYPLIFILLIRSLGIDLKSFGFQEDKEFVEINEEDREEVEVNVGFDKEKWLRKVKYYFRNTKYFIVEHKSSLLVVFGIVLFIGIIQFYNYFYVENRIYKLNENITANHYKLKVKNTYLTDRDFSGNIITNDNSYFVIASVDIKNLVSTPRVFDYKKFLLYINDDYYAPTVKYNRYFKDMGNLYDEKEINGKEATSYILIYEVPKPSGKANFVLKYQDIYNKKLIRIKVKILDISEFKNKGEQTYPNIFEIPINENKIMKFKINNYEISDTFNYTYQKCDSTGTCPIYEDTYNSNGINKVLHIKFNLEDSDRKEFLSFANSYAKIRYKINGEEKILSLKYAITREYRGNHLYLIVPNEINDASNIDLLFTIRSYRYTYHLKGE